MLPYWDGELCETNLCDLSFLDHFNNSMVYFAVVLMSLAVLPNLPYHVCCNHLKPSQALHVLRMYAPDNKTLTRDNGAAVLKRPVGESLVNNWRTAMTMK